MAYDEHFFTNVQPRITGYELRSEWISDEGVLQEYVLEVDDPDGGSNRHHIIGILTFGTTATLSGERLYASDELIAFNVGPVLDKAHAC